MEVRPGALIRSQGDGFHIGDEALIGKNRGWLRDFIYRWWKLGSENRSSPEQGSSRCGSIREEGKSFYAIRNLASRHSLVVVGWEITVNCSVDIQVRGLELKTLLGLLEDSILLTCNF